MQCASMFYEHGCYKIYGYLLSAFLCGYKPLGLVRHGVPRGGDTRIVQHDVDVVRLHLQIFIHDLKEGAHVRGIK